MTKCDCEYEIEVPQEDINTMIHDAICEYVSERPMCVVNAEDPEGHEIEIYYKGQKVTNCAKMYFHGENMKTENDLKITIIEKVTNWKERIQNGN